MIPPTPAPEYDLARVAWRTVAIRQHPETANLQGLSDPESYATRELAALAAVGPDAVGQVDAPVTGRDCPVGRGLADGARRPVVAVEPR